jgi:hypothetical protein
MKIASQDRQLKANRQPNNQQSSSLSCHSHSPTVVRVLFAAQTPETAWMEQLLNAQASAALRQASALNAPQAAKAMKMHPGMLHSPRSRQSAALSAAFARS